MQILWDPDIETSLIRFVRISKISDPVVSEKYFSVSWWIERDVKKKFMRVGYYLVMRS
ncbi:MAG TPA: hypothetical protein VK622_04400 [Puia sp.]|nr:hypothetical protein [Puia sp.]